MPQPWVVDAHALESWDDDFEFSSTASSHRNQDQRLPSSVPHSSPTPASESWDDTYEDEDSPNYRHTPTSRLETDGELDSWGSGSDYQWSGTNESVEATTNGGTRSYSHPSSHSSSSVSHSPARSSPGSFFARLSPIKKWKGPKTFTDPKSAEPTAQPQLPSLKRVFSPSSTPSPSKKPRPFALSPCTPVSEEKWPTPRTNNFPLSDCSPPSVHATPRRSSLSDLRHPQLKIPSRISRAQCDIKRDIADVKEFATCIKQLQTFQHTYTRMLRNLHAVFSLPSQPSSSSCLTPFSPICTLDLPSTPKSPTATKFSTYKKHNDTEHLPSSPHPLYVDSSPQPTKRKFSFTPSLRRNGQGRPLSPSRTTHLASSNPLHTPSPEFITNLAHLTATYGVWWECAHVLVELGDNNRDEEGGSSDDAGAWTSLGLNMRIGPRPRAVTLASDRPVSISEDLDDTDRKNIDDEASDGAHNKGRAKKGDSSQKSWHATTGRANRGVLTPRQILLLQSMLESGGKAWDPKAVETYPGRESGNGNWRGAIEMRRGLRGLWMGVKKAQSKYELSGGHTTESPTVVGPEANDKNNRKGGRKTVASSSPPKRTVSPSSERDLMRENSLTTTTRNKTTATITPANTGVLSIQKKPLRRPSLAGIFGGGKRDAHQEAREENIMRVNTSKSKLDNSSVNVQSSPHARDSLSSPPSPYAQVSSVSSPEKHKSISNSKFKKTNTLYSPSSSPITQNSPTTIRLKPSLGLVSQTPKLRLSLKPGTTRQFVTPENISPLLVCAQEVAVHLNECISEFRTMMSDVGAV